MDFNQFVSDVRSGKRGATERQILLATKIANVLGLPTPNFGDFFETAEFINCNLGEYNNYLCALNVGGPNE